MTNCHPQTTMINEFNVRGVNAVSHYVQESSKNTLNRRIHQVSDCSFRENTDQFYRAADTLRVRLARAMSSYAEKNTERRCDSSR